MAPLYSNPHLREYWIYKKTNRYRDEWFVAVVMLKQNSFFGMVAMLRYLDSCLIVLDVPRAGS